jgi:hypothetical protein
MSGFRLRTSLSRLYVFVEPVGQSQMAGCHRRRDLELPPPGSARAMMALKAFQVHGQKILQGVEAGIISQVGGL